MSVVKVTVVLSCIVFLCCVLGQVHGFRRMNTGLPDLSNLNGKVAEAVKALELNSAETAVMQAINNEYAGSSQWRKQAVLSSSKDESATAKYRMRMEAINGQRTAVFLCDATSTSTNQYVPAFAASCISEDPAIVSTRRQ